MSLASLTATLPDTNASVSRREWKLGHQTPRRVSVRTSGPAITTLNCFRPVRPSEARVPGRVGNGRLVRHNRRDRNSGAAEDETARAAATKIRRRRPKFKSAKALGREARGACDQSQLFFANWGRCYGGAGARTAWRRTIFARPYVLRLRRLLFSLKAAGPPGSSRCMDRMVLSMSDGQEAIAIGGACGEILVHGLSNPTQAQVGFGC